MKIPKKMMDKLCSQLHKRSLEFIAFKEYQGSEPHQFSFTSKGLIRRIAPEDEVRRHEDKFGKWLNKQSDSAAIQMERLHLAWRSAEAKIKLRQTRALYLGMSGNCRSDTAVG